MADHRLRVAPSRVAMVAAEIANALGVTVNFEADSEDKKALFPGAPDGVKEFDQWISACADDLEESGAKSLVLAGTRQSKVVQELAFAINQKLGSVGSTVKAVKTDLGQYGTIADLSSGLEKGGIKNVILLTPADPVYDADGFAALLEKAETTIHWGLRTNATAWACDWHLPAAHYLESWADARSEAGTLSLLQPMILPLYGGVSELDFLHVLLGGQLGEGEYSPAMSEVKKTFEARKADDAAWRAALREGFAAGTEYAQAKVSPTVSKVSIPGSLSKDQIEIVFATDASVLDGRFIDNAWLQESPDPVTKLTWDNAAQISPQTAKDLGIYDAILGENRLIDVEDSQPFLGMTKSFKQAAEAPIGEGEHAKAPLITVSVSGREVTLPVLLAFGHGLWARRQCNHHSTWIRTGCRRRA